MSPSSTSQSFLRELDKKLWTASDRLRSNIDAAVCKHAVLGLIFLKYVSDSFAQRQAEIEEMIKDPNNYFFIDPDGYDKPARYEDAIHQGWGSGTTIEKNVFWVPALARWKANQAEARTLATLRDTLLPKLLSGESAATANYLTPISKR